MLSHTLKQTKQQNTPLFKTMTIGGSPLAIGVIATVMMATTDVFLASITNGSNALASVGIATALLNIAMLFCLSLTSMSPNLFNSIQDHHLNRNVRQGIYTIVMTNIFLGGIFIAILWSPKTILMLLGQPIETIAVASEYIETRKWILPFIGIIGMYHGFIHQETPIRKHAISLSLIHI